MDPAAYSDTPRGDWSRGIEKEGGRAIGPSKDWFEIKENNNKVQKICKILHSTHASIYFSMFK